MHAVYKRFCDILAAFEIGLKKEGYSFMYDNHLGYIASCPSKIGTGMRMGVSINIPMLSANEPQFAPLCHRLGLSYMFPSKSTAWIDVSNSGRLGASEAEFVQAVVNGAKILIDLEKTKSKTAMQEFLITLPEEFQCPIIDNSGNIADDDTQTTPVNTTNEGQSDFPLLPPSTTTTVWKHLTPAIYENLSKVKTDGDFTIQDAILGAIEYPTSSIGVIAGTKEHYESWRELFTPLIKDVHEVDKLGELEIIRLSKAGQARPITVPKALDISRVHSFGLTFTRNLEGYPVLISYKQRPTKRCYEDNS